MKKTILILALSLSVSSFAADKKKEKLPALMHQFYGSLLQMKPYMASVDDFKNEKNKEHVLQILTNLENKMETTEVSDLKAPGFDATFNLMARNLRDTKYLYERQIYEMAWNRFRATSQFCITCHDRLPKSTGKFQWPQLQGLETLSSESILKEADFFYIAHQYEPALKAYDHVIRNFKFDPKVDQSAILDHAYQRKIAFFARITRNPKEAIQSLKLDLKNQQLPLDTKKNIESWIYYFQAWAKEGQADPSKFSDTRLIEYSRNAIEKLSSGRRIAVSDPYVVDLLRVSGLLYERAFRKPKSAETPELLYLLGKAERDLAPIRVYSLPDVYFKECVYLAPKNAVAKQCLAEYELSMKQKHRTGASDYIDAGIEEMRKLVK